MSSPHIDLAEWQLHGQLASRVSSWEVALPVRRFSCRHADLRGGKTPEYQ